MVWLFVVTRQYRTSVWLEQVFSAWIWFGLEKGPVFPNHKHIISNVAKEKTVQSGSLNKRDSIKLFISGSATLDVSLRTQISHHVVFTTELDSICGCSLGGREGCYAQVCLSAEERMPILGTSTAKTGTASVVLSFPCLLRTLKSLWIFLMVHQPTDAAGAVPLLPMADLLWQACSLSVCFRRQREREREYS